MAVTEKNEVYITRTATLFKDTFFLNWKRMPQQLHLPLLQSLKTTLFITHRVHLHVASNMENFCSSYKFYGFEEVDAWLLVDLWGEAHLNLILHVFLCLKFFHFNMFVTETCKIVMWYYFFLIHSYNLWNLTSV